MLPEEDIEHLDAEERTAYIVAVTGVSRATERLTVAYRIGEGDGEHEKIKVTSPNYIVLYSIEKLQGAESISDVETAIYDAWPAPKHTEDIGTVDWREPEVEEP
ncbi:hypothetical protein DVK00_02890 [Haloarcula sp. Atlit-47R]|uniref:hypothetical protein n=1 Tax=Haloarcula sp. Atlit-47R TaxID=2282132 RepID=UPI000EF23FF7|nr:hypothetical protein [Haloarcula sp. Atlit-47R]RLM47471.1 hypothetical protein DVK00_02890 [Haloarcula sp. Atlit-47R]